MTLLVWIFMLPLVVSRGICHIRIYLSLIVKYYAWSSYASAKHENNYYEVGFGNPLTDCTVSAYFLSNIPTNIHYGKSAYVSLKPGIIGFSMLLLWCHSFGYQTSAEFVSLFWIFQRAWLMATICFVKGIFQSIQNNTNTNILPKYSIE